MKYDFKFSYRNSEGKPTWEELVRLEKYEALIDEFLESWNRFEKMFDEFNDVWHIDGKVFTFIEKEREKWEAKKNEMS